jgi:hypothetical protein
MLYTAEGETAGADLAARWQRGSGWKPGPDSIAALEWRHMSGLRKQELAAIQAVARHFSATWEAGDATCNGAISIAGKRIAIEVTTVRQRVADRTGLARPRLRFDKVVRGLMTRLQDALREVVPAGTTVIFTVTAPIRLPSKTAEALEDNIRAMLARRSAPVRYVDTIHGNQVRVRLVKSDLRQCAQVTGLVHNPGPDQDMLLEMAESLLHHIGVVADRRAPANSAEERWLAVIVEDGSWPIETYRQVYAQLSLSTGFAKLLLVFTDGRVELLSG